MRLLLLRLPSRKEANTMIDTIKISACDCGSDCSCGSCGCGKK
jgi:hypothetical protein